MAGLVLHGLDARRIGSDHFYQKANRRPVTLLIACGSFLWLLQASPEKYTVHGRTDCWITLCTSPAISAGRLCPRQANAVAYYDLRAEA